ncbi:MAG: O-antigen ligase family protein [Saprospiraceae bacterium]|nr:O-antigen ligase family protein [Saprospiraceae bacterium]
MATKKTNKRKHDSKLVRKNLPDGIVWIYAIIFIFVISLVYYQKVIDISLSPRFFALAISLFVFYLFFGFIKKYKIIEVSLLQRSPVLAWIAFILISIISLTKAITPAEGLFDILTRVLSLFFLILTCSILINTKNIKAFTVVATVLAVVLIAIGFYQYFTHVFRHSDLDSLYKVTGIYSHKNVFSAFFFMLIPFVFYELIRVNNANRFLYAIILFFDFVIIILLQTRSVWLSVIVFLIIFSVLILLFRKGIFTSQTKSDYLKGIIIFICTFLIAVAISWLLTSYSNNNIYNSHKKALQKTTTENSNKSADIASLDKRAASIFDTKSENSNQRIIVWAYTTKMIKENPILGVGAGNWKILIPSYFDSEYLKDYHHLWRRPHNDFVWITAEKGFLGLISYLVFLVLLVFYTLKILIKSDNPELKILAIILLGGIGGYCTDSLFSFPFERIEHQVIFMFFAAGIIWVYHISFPLKSKTKKISKQLFLSISLLLLFASIIYGNICIKSEKSTNYANLAIQGEYWDMAIDLVDKGYSPLAPLDPRNCPILWYRGKSYMKLGKNDLALADFEKAVEQNPYTEYVLVDFGVLYGTLGNHEKSIELFNRAIEIFPYYRDALLNLGVAYYRKGDLEKALETFNKCKQEDKVDKKLDFTIDEIEKKLEENKKDTTYNE